MCPFTVRRLVWFGLVWFVCSICSPRTQTICGVIASVTVNNHKFHSFPCALFTIQLQHRLHCNKRTVYSRFGYMNHYHLRTLVLCERLNPKQIFPPFWCIGFCISSDWLSHRERRHTNTMGKSEQGDTNCVDGDEIDNNWPNAKSSLSNDRNGKTITMNEMTK